MIQWKSRSWQIGSTCRSGLATASFRIMRCKAGWIRFPARGSPPQKNRQSGSHQPKAPRPRQAAETHVLAHRQFENGPAFPHSLAGWIGWCTAEVAMSRIRTLIVIAAMLPLAACASSGKPGAGSLSLPSIDPRLSAEQNLERLAAAEAAGASGLQSDALQPPLPPGIE